MNKKISIVLTGVGGQGVITAAKMLGDAAVSAGVPVYVSEIHGMAQRGGDVVCTVRMGAVESPMLLMGTADALVSTEPVEAVRNVMYVNPKTKLVTDTTPTIPFTVAAGGEPYPKLDAILKDLALYAQVYPVDAIKLAKEAGAVITKNIVLLGALSAVDVLPFSHEVLLKAILDDVPAKYQDINKKAFEAGRQAVLNKR
jgi:indolepyruvate ferredoxin oxidoreductase, beta subunit